MAAAMAACIPVCRQISRDFSKHFRAARQSPKESRARPIPSRARAIPLRSRVSLEREQAQEFAESPLGIPSGFGTFHGLLEIAGRQTQVADRLCQFGRSEGGGLKVLLSSQHGKGLRTEQLEKEGVEAFGVIVVGQNSQGLPGVIPRERLAGRAEDADAFRIQGVLSPPGHVLGETLRIRPRRRPGEGLGRGELPGSQPLRHAPGIGGVPRGEGFEGLHVWGPEGDQDLLGSLRHRVGHGLRRRGGGEHQENPERKRSPELHGFPSFTPQDTTSQGGSSTARFARSAPTAQPP